MLVFAVASGLVAAYQIAHSPYHEISSLPHRFDDFMIYWRRVPLVHTESFFFAPDGDRFGSGWGYPAPAIWVYRFFYLFDARSVIHPKRGLLAMELVALAATLFAAHRFFLAARTRGLLSTSALCLCTVAITSSWPILFALQRGNIEILLWLPLAAALWAFHRGRFTLAAVLIGTAAAVKIYPLILLALFLPSRRLLQIALALGLTVAITLLSLWYIGPTLPFALHHLGLGISGVLQTQGEGLNWSLEGYNHSFFHLTKILVEEHGSTSALHDIVPAYMVIAAVSMTLLYLFRVLRLPVINQLTVLTIAMVYLPPISYDYTLQVLFLPWTMLALVIIQRSSLSLPALRGELLAMVLFALILAPELFLIHHTYNHSGTLKSLCLGALLLLACLTPWPEAEVAAPPATLTI